MKQGVTQRWKRFWHRLSLTARILILSVVVLLVGARLAMPYAVKHYVNRKLDQLPEYGGSIGDVNVHLWRGAYTIHNVNITKTGGEIPVPFVAARQIDFSMQWKELWRHRALVGEIEADVAQLNFVKGKTKEESQTSIDKSWTDVVGQLFPFKINRFEIRDSEVWFRDFGTRPKVDIFVTNLHVICHNITNSRNDTNELPTPFQVRGLTLGGGQLEVSGGLNPFTESPRFDVNARIENMDLVALNDFLRAYAKVDVKRGRLRFYTEMAAADGRFKGYVKPLLEDIDIVDLKDAKHPLKLFWETLVAGVVKVFKNQPKDRFGAEISIEGAIENPKAGVLSAIGSLLKNAFIRALSPRVEQKIDIESVKPDPGARPPPVRDTKKGDGG